jgi:hypothetical protein
MRRELRFNKLLEFLEEHGGGAGVANFSKGSSVANALLAIIKLIAYYACLETDVTLSGQPPLVRTKSPYPAEAGETRIITGSVREKHRELASRQLFASAGQCCRGRRHRFQPSQ